MLRLLLATALAAATVTPALAREDADVSPAVAELSRTAADILKQVNTKPSGKHGSNSQQAA